MRNWNFLPQAYSSPSELLPDYLWGIETLEHICWLYHLDRFQTTYEELKHNFYISNRKYARFQTTYEELKLPKEW